MVRLGDTMQWSDAVLFLALSSCAPIAQAQEAADPGQERYVLRHWDSIHVDQDLFAGSLNEDRNYTMGTMWLWEHDKAVRHAMNTSRYLGAVDRLGGIEHDARTQQSVAWGFSAFTPDRLEAYGVIEEDRPYSSLLYTSTTLTDRGADPRSMRTTQLTVGLLGLPLTQWGQTAFHQAYRAFPPRSDKPYDPKGWNHQISDGGEPTFMYKLAWLRRPLDGPVGDLSYSLDASVGYYTNVSLGGAVRLGVFDKTGEWWRAIKDIDPQSGANRVLNQEPAQGPQHELYMLLGARATLVGYNALLQGQFRDSDHEFGNSDMERLVLEGSIGLNWTLPSTRRFWIVCTQRSAEHKRAERRAHSWCGINYQTPLR